MDKLFANSGDPDQTLHSVASDLGLHCFHVPFYGSPNYNGLMVKELHKKKGRSSPILR